MSNSFPKIFPAHQRSNLHTPEAVINNLADDKGLTGPWWTPDLLDRMAQAI